MSRPPPDALGSYWNPQAVAEAERLLAGLKAWRSVHPDVVAKFSDALLGVVLEEEERPSSGWRAALHACADDARRAAEDARQQVEETAAKMWFEMRGVEWMKWEDEPPGGFDDDDDGVSARGSETIRNLEAERRKLAGRVVAGELVLSAACAELKTVVDKAVSGEWMRRHRERFAAMFPQLMPDEFDPAKFGGDLPAFNAVVNFEYPDDDDRCGLYLGGADSGAGKTRAALAFVWKNYGPESALSLWTAEALKSQLEEFRAAPKKKTALLESMGAADAVLIDDLGHVFTDTFASYLRQLLELRGPRGLIITSNYTLEEILARAKKNKCEVAVQTVCRRIGESTILEQAFVRRP